MPFQTSAFMNRRGNVLGTAVAAVFAAGLTFAGPAAATFPPDVIECRAAIGKASTKLGKTHAKTVASCHRTRNRDASHAATDCNDLATADLRSKLPAAESRFRSTVTSRCSGVEPADANFSSCPAPCADDVPALTGMEDVASCLVCLSRERVEALGNEIHGDPASPLDDDARACADAVASASAKLFPSLLKDMTRCQAREEAAGAETSSWCTNDSFPSDNAEDVMMDAENKIVAACDVSDFGPLDSCAETQFGIAECASAETASSAQLLAGDVLTSVPATTTTSSTTTTSTSTTTTSTTTTIPPGDPQCPDLGELVLLARDTNIECDDNADCAAPRTCNTTAGICQSRSDLDSGWTGHAHNSDLDDGVVTLTRINCPGPAPVCGECSIQGVAPDPGNCRCANNTRTICDEPFAADADNCGGAVCECYFGVPIPLSSAGTPACIVNRYSQDLTGTVNVDLGEQSVAAKLRTRVYLGITTDLPCPVCAGRCSNNPATACKFDSECGAGNTCNQDVPNDGVRNGLCIEGNNAGLTCDVGGINPSFPARNAAQNGGGGYSLDCMPLVGKNISGAGLNLAVTQTTGTSTLEANLPCTGGECHCKTCSASPTSACNSNADCSGGSCAVSANFSCDDNADCTNLNLGNCTGINRCQLATSVTCATNADCQGYDNGGPCNPSTCSALGTGTPPEPNECTDGICNDLGNGESQCATGPNDKYCDGLIRANGLGILSCTTNSDCTANDPLNGACTLSQRRACFMDTIVATGDADTEFPVGAAAFCVPPTSNSSINDVAGLPGPTRVTNQGSARALCASDHNVEYQAGVGGCP